MTILQEIQGDVFEALDARKGPTVFMHGCNMQGQMGSGVAKLVRDRWPHVYTDYSSRLRHHDHKLGDVLFTIVALDPEIRVANALTQEFYGQDGKVYADADAIRRALGRVDFEFGDHWSFVSVQVGCGLGGLDWEEIRQLYEDARHEWTIYYL